MGQFKPMVKMQTTEPSVVLKLKKGGSVCKPVKKMAGGPMGEMSAMPAMRSRMSAPAAAAPAKPSLAERRRAMMGRKGMAAPMMAKKGGEVESKAMHAKEATKAELKAHANKPASKAHKGLKTGGVVKGQGGYKTGGVVKGQGGYKKGGAVKKFADGGSVQDDGRAVEMPQGKKKPTPPVSISKLSGTFKKGGAVKKADGGSISNYEKDFGRNADSQLAKETKGYEDHNKREAEENRAMREAMNPMNLVRKARDAFKGQGAVTDTEREISRTVSPPQKKRRGGYAKGDRC
jgi:hypothetical protein